MKPSDESTWKAYLADLVQSGPSIPLDRASFVAALEDGRGRVCLHAEERGLEGVLGQVVHATWNCLAFDPQEEGTRGDWSLQLLDAAGKFEEGAALIQALASPDSIQRPVPGRWTEVQRVNVLRTLAARGLGWAKDVLDRAEAEENASPRKVVAREADGEVEYVQRAESAEGDGFSWCRSTGPHECAKEVIAWIEGQEGEVRASGRPHGRFELRRWGRTATPDALDEIVTAWNEAAGDLKRLLYSFIFQGRREVPFVTETMLDAARSGNEMLKMSTLKALKGVADPRLRSLALSLVSPMGLLDGGLALLSANYQEGDAAKIESALFQLLPEADLAASSRQRLSPEQRHRLGKILLDLGGAKHPELLALMVAAHEITPCGECRGFLACRMASMGNVPGWLRREIVLQPRGAEESWPWDA
jgi:hypothetical protein